MCVIAIYRGRREKSENLRAMETTNSDGIGVVYYEKGMPAYKKDIPIKEAIELNKTLPFPYAFHFRLVTVGQNKLLTHPFEVTPKSELKMEGKAEMLLMHNGHWGDWNEALLNHSINTGKDIPNGDWSDSRAMAYLGGVVGPNMLKMLSGQKVALFKKDKQITVYGSGWENEKEVLYSNKYWSFRTYQSYGKDTTPTRSLYEGYRQPYIDEDMEKMYQWDSDTKTLKRLQGTDKGVKDEKK